MREPNKPPTVPSVDDIVTRPFAAWLDKNCDLKRHHIGPVALPENGGKPYECDYWYFVIDDQDDGETPAIAFKVSHEDRSGYMGVEIENYFENGTVEATCFVGLLTSVEDLESVLKVLVRANR